MRVLIHENRKLIKFLLTCLSGYIGWFLIYTIWLSPSQNLDLWLSHIEAEEIVFLLKIVGVKINLILESGYKYAFYIGNTRTIGLASSCNGLVLFPLFSFFIIATPGYWKYKIYYILTGCFAIFQVNILRIISLIFVQINHPESLDFNHKYTFTVLVYAFIFFLWHIWIKYFSNSTKDKKNV